MRSGQRVPTLYLAETLEAALLETSLHNVSALMPRVIDEKVLLGKLHAQVVPPRELFLADLRDHQLPALGLTRRTSPAAPRALPLHTGSLRPSTPLLSSDPAPMASSGTHDRPSSPGALRKRSPSSSLTVSTPAAPPGHSLPKLTASGALL